MKSFGIYPSLLVFAFLSENAVLVAAHRYSVLPQLQAADLSARDERGRTLLMEAALAGNAEAVNHLCAMGANVHATDKDGNTALHLSAEEGGHAAALLLAAGADPKAVNGEGDTPLIHALTCGYPIPLLPLLQAYQEHGIDIGEEEDIDGIRAVIYAVRRCVTAELKLLLALGADVRECDEKGDTPLLLAARYGRTASVRALLAWGADPNTCNQEDETPLHLAVRGNRAEMVELLLAAGAQPDAADAGGHTPLRIAVAQGHFLIAEQLVEAGADVTARFPMKQLDALWSESVVAENNRPFRRATLEALGAILRAFRQACRASAQADEEESFNYLFLAVFHLRPTLARLLVRRCPSLLPPEAEEAFYRFLAVELEYY